MRFTMPLLRRFFGKLIHDILPAALASLLGGFLITHFQLNHLPEPVTVPVARASPEMMQLLRDEHGLIGNFVKAQVANEKSANEKSANEKKQSAAADEGAVRAPTETQQTALAAAVPAARPAAIIALAPAKLAAPHARPPVIGASLPPLAAAPTPQSESAAPPAARNDDSLLAKTIGIKDGIKDHVVAATQRAVSTIVGIPSWFGSIGDRIGGEDPSPRPPANLVSEL